MKNKKKEIDPLLTKSQLRQRGWTGYKIYHLAPKPIYEDGIPKWKLSDIEKAESRLSFYLDEVD